MNLASRLAFIISGVLTAKPAFAHAGDHTSMGLAAMIDHLLTSPFHVAGIGLVALAVLAGLFALRRKAGPKANAVRRTKR